MTKTIKILLVLLTLTLLVITCKKEESSVTKDEKIDEESDLSESEDIKFDLVFGVTPWDDKDIMQTKFTPTLNYLSEKLNKKIKFTLSKDYNTLCEEIGQGLIDFGSFSPGAYVDAKNKYPELKYIVTTIDKKTGKDSYLGYIFTHKDTGITSFQQLKDKVFGFVDEGSSSGYKYPVAMMIDKWRVDPNAYFKKTFFLGNHANVLDAVRNMKVDAGATWDVAMESDVNEKGDDPYFIIAKTDPIPYDGWLAKKDLDDKLIEEIKNILIGINTETQNKDGVNVINDFYYGGFVVRNDSFYNVLRTAVKALEKLKK